MKLLSQDTLAFGMVTYLCILGFIILKYAHKNFERERANYAAWKKFTVSRMGDVSFLIAIYFFYQTFQTFYIAGHGSHTENNPHEVGLSCGACSGQSGEFSARFACELFNLPSVREYLKQENISIPDQCRFIPAMHETVTDEIIIFREQDIDKEFFPILKSWIQKATQDNLKEKQMSLGLDPTKAVARSKDWAEVFPEAGLECRGNFK